MADETEKITYEIVIDDSKATASGKKVADTFKGVSDASKNAKASTADYSDGLNKLAPGLESTTKGFGGLLSSFKAILLNPIGLVLAAVATAFTVIKAAIEKSEPALDFIENIFTAITQTVNTLLDNLELVGDFFGNLLVGNLQAAGAAFGKLTDEISKNNNEAQKFLDLSRELEDAQLSFRISTADTENQIKALIIASKNKNLSFDEAAAKLKEATELERGLTATRVELAQKEAEIEVGKIALSKSVRKEQNESFEEFVKRIVASGQFSGEESSKIVGYYEASKRAASDSLAFQEKVQNQLDSFAEKKAADAQKERDRLLAINELEKTLSDQRIERAIKEREALDQGVIGYLDGIIAKKDAQAEFDASVQESFDAESQSEQDAANQSFELNKKKTEDSKKQTQIDFLLGQQKLSNASTVFSQISGLLDKQSAAYKVLAISQASIDTFRAATAALAPPPIGAGPLFGPILAATTVALGLANIAKIAGFAEGGLSGTRILNGMGKSIYRSNGDNMLATIKTGEVILNEDQQARLGGARTFAAIGVPGFAAGGLSSPFETSAVANQINNERQMSTLISVLKNSSQRVLVIEEVEALIDQRLQIRQQATI